MKTDKPTMIPFSKLALSAENARRTNKAPNIAALAASIAALGVLQNLVVSRAEDGTYPVHAGERRFHAIQSLIEEGKLSADFPVPCKVIPQSEATAASLAENTQREAMHAADEFDAFKRLQSEGMTIDGIADAFGVTPLVVERRLKLAQAAPELLDAFRRDELTTDQLLALCSTDDHARQVAVWNRPKYLGDSPRDLRRAVLETEIDASTDKRVAYVGLDAYRAAGGDVRRDLFGGDGDGGFLTDGVLLDRLVGEKMERDAEALRQEGWGWVEVWPQQDYAAFNRFGHAPTCDAALSAEDQAKIAMLEDEDEALQKEYNALEEASEERGLNAEENDRIDEIDERRRDIDDEIEALREGYAPEVKAKSGALLILHNDKVEIVRGLVRTSDRKAVGEVVGDANAVTGGRETEPAGRKPDELSDALRRSLLGHRNLAAQIETAARPDVAKVLLGCWAVKHIERTCTTKWTWDDYVPTDLGVSTNFNTGQGTRCAHDITDEGGKKKREAFDKQAARAIAGLPKSEGALWDALTAMKPAQLDAIIAYAVALSVSLSKDNDGLTGKLIGALGLDMAAHFTPTVENYLGRVPKQLVIEALNEAGKPTGEAVQALKKGELAAHAEKELAGSGWVPKAIRTPKPKKPAAPKAAAPATAKPKAATAAKSKAKAAPTKAKKPAAKKKAS